MGKPDCIREELSRDSDSIVPKYNTITIVGILPLSQSPDSHGTIKRPYDLWIQRNSLAQANNKSRVLNAEEK